MTAAYRITVAERRDLAIVTVICECDTALSLRIESAMIPERCASCGKPFNEKTKAALGALARFHRDGKAAEEIAGKPVFRFEIRTDDEAEGGK